TPAAATAATAGEAATAGTRTGAWRGGSRGDGGGHGAAEIPAQVGERLHAVEVPAVPAGVVALLPQYFRHLPLKTLAPGVLYAECIGIRQECFKHFGREFG